MTGDELEQRMSFHELLEWKEKFLMEHEWHEKARAEAKAKTKSRRR